MPLESSLAGLKWLGEHFGFGAIVAIILLSWGKNVLVALTLEMADLTRAVTLAILAMSFAPKGIHDQASEIKTDIEERQARRKKP